MSSCQFVGKPNSPSRASKGYISIGDDGGGNVFLMLNKELEETVLIVDSGDLNPNNAGVITTNFTEWINDGCLSKTEEVNHTESFDTCSIVLIKTPEGGLKDLVEIKSVL